METKKLDDNGKLNFFIRQFYIKNSLDTFSSIIKWWESRRLLYNLYNLCALIIGILLIICFNPSIVNFFIIPFIISYGVLLNFVYFLGWLIIGISKYTWKNINVIVFTSITLIVFISMTFFITIFLCVGYLIINIP
jgi:hypothetical protein